MPGHAGEPMALSHYWRQLKSCNRIEKGLSHAALFRCSRQLLRCRVSSSQLGADSGEGAEGEINLILRVGRRKLNPYARLAARYHREGEAYRVHAFLQKFRGHFLG